MDGFVFAGACAAELFIDAFIGAQRVVIQRFALLGNQQRFTRANSIALQMVHFF